jgi:hypothetical protein
LKARSVKTEPRVFRSATCLRIALFRLWSWRARAQRPGLDQLLAHALRGQFEIVLCRAFDRVAQSTIQLEEPLPLLDSGHKSRTWMSRSPRPSASHRKPA